MQIEEKPPFDTPYEWIGGEDKVQQLVARFYDLMDLEPGYKELRAAHGSTLDDAVRARINGAVRTALSPRFVPDDIFAVAEVPRTLSGKKQELPIKKLLLGQPIEKVVNKDAMANPGCLDWYVAFAAERAAQPVAASKPGG